MKPCKILFQNDALIKIWDYLYTGLQNLMQAWEVGKCVTYIFWSSVFFQICQFLAEKEEIQNFH